MNGMSGPQPDYVASERRQRHIDSLVLRLLLSAKARELWSVQELAKEIGDEIATADSLDRLHAVGLVHRLQGYVFATRAGARADELMQDE
jgi:predicted transcriptional regulator